MTEELQKQDTIVPDCLFESDNDLEVPTLRLDVQPSVCEIPFLCFGEQKRTLNMNGRGTLHFYTDDYRFSAVFDHPERILAHNPRSIVEPNFSLYSETPVAFGLQAIYKKRWIARSMQEKGIGVFVDLNVNSKFYKLNLLGIPAGYHAFCTRGYSERLQYLQYEYDMACAIAGSHPLFVIYGGGEACKAFARKNGCIYITPVIAMKNSLKSFEKITQSIAFVEPETDVKKLLTQKRNETFANQILNFSEYTMLGEHTTKQSPTDDK